MEVCTERQRVAADFKKTFTKQEVSIDSKKKQSCGSGRIW